ncbi:MAG TPA: DUF1549 domain-containing protein, partial [Pirellulales bacterium]|nr:DUF1549 domain-containing protein [Pirellulales bacterium]
MQQFIAAVTFAIFAAASARAEEPALPPAVARQVDFHKDILPILANSCARCHAGGKRKGGFAIDTRASLMQGGESGPAVVVGNSAASRLVALVAGLEPEVIMPAQGPRLSSDQVGILRGWIDQGLPWEDGFSFKKIASVPWEPRRVELPPAPDGSSLTNPIDRLLAPYFASQGFRPPSTVDERTFLRRAYLDLVGLLPTPEVAEAFLSDVSPVKRARVVQQLLAARRNYAIHWLS